MFAKATKEAAKLRMAIHGPSGAGKTYTALTIASALGQRVAVLDTESGSASKYADIFDFDVAVVDPPYTVAKFLDVLRVASAEGYDVLVVDSLTHFWKGSGGVLELVDAVADRQAARSGKRDTFSAWKEGDAAYRRMIDAVLASPLHVIVTMRAKQLVEKDQATGKIRKLGLAPEIRDGAEYEFDIEGMLDMDHRMHVGKTRMPSLSGRSVQPEDAGRLGAEILAWASSGATPKPKLAAVPEPRPTPAPEGGPREAVVSNFDRLATRVYDAMELVDLDAVAVAIKAASGSLSADQMRTLRADFARARERILASHEAAAQTPDRETGQEG